MKNLLSIMPKTGDDREVVLWVVLGVGALAVLAVAIIFGFKNKNK